MNKSYAVFGLGRYGHAVAKELCLGGADVLAVDIDETLVNSTIVDVPLCKCADVTDPETIKKLGVAQMDVVIVAMANNLEASVMAIMLCKELGVPTVIAKCKDEIQGKILSRSCRCCGCGLWRNRNGRLRRHKSVCGNSGTII